MHCNDSPKLWQKIYRGRAFTSSICACHYRGLSDSAHMILLGRELMVRPPAPPPPSCTDSTFDNEEEMLFQLKPQAMFEEKK